MHIIIPTQFNAFSCQSTFQANPRDEYWGIGRGDGLNMLGKTLMRVRSELRGGGGGSEDDAGPAIASYVPSYQLKKGSILTASEQYIVHQCNCVSKFAKGWF